MDTTAYVPFSTTVELIDAHFAAADRRFDTISKAAKGRPSNKQFEQLHEANGAMLALRALRDELIKKPTRQVPLTDVWNERTPEPATPPAPVGGENPDPAT